MQFINKEHPFFRAYVECAQWASHDEDVTDWESKEFDQDALDLMLLDCQHFYQRVECYLDAIHERKDLGGTGGPWTLEEQAGHDFFLSRNEHGTGFWDRPEIYGEYYAKMFHRISKCYGWQEVLGSNDSEYLEAYNSG